MRKRLLGVIALGLIGIAPVAGASIVDSADGTYLTDTATGLDWLDVTATTGRSYFDVQAQLGPGQAYSGWRHATLDEFNQLVSNFTGLPIATYDRVEQEPNLIDPLVVLLGSSLDVGWIRTKGVTWDAFNGYAEGEGFDMSAGILADLNPHSPDENVFAVLWDDDQPGGQQDYSFAHAGHVAKPYAPAEIGHFLVRGTGSPPVASIPEGSSLALVCLAVGLLSAFAPKRR